MRLAFGSMAGRSDALFQSLRSMSLRRDAKAPVDPSMADLQEFEERSDVRDLRSSLEMARKAGDKKASRSFTSQLNNLIQTIAAEGSRKEERIL